MKKERWKQNRSFPRDWNLEGMTRKLVVYTNLPNYNDYSTINRRVNQLEPEIELPKVGRISATCDGSGIKMNNASDYRQEKYGRKKQKKYIKVTITANPFTKDLLDCDVHIEGDGPSEPEIAVSHLEELIKEGFEIDKFWGDGSFDCKDLFNFLQRYGILSAIKIRENASNKSDGSMRRAREVKEYKEKGYEKWARDKHYGRRWTGTEGIISSVKVKFGDKVRAKEEGNMCKEVKRRFWAYQRMKTYADARVAA